MKKILVNLLKTFAWKFAYAALAEVIAVLSLGIEKYVPQGQTDTALWSALVLPALAGLVGVLKRVLTWDPAKA